jgi:chemotaxis protein MotA
MLIFIGALIVMASAIGGFMLAGGNPLVLLQVGEMVVIFGIGFGVLVIASPGQVLLDIVHKSRWLSPAMPPVGRSISNC